MKVGRCVQTKVGQVLLRSATVKPSGLGLLGRFRCEYGEVIVWSFGIHLKNLGPG